MLNITESAEQKYTTILEFHPGTSCELNCIFCYRGGRTYNSAREAITIACLKNLICDFVKLGGREFYISGGVEPFSQTEAVDFAIRYGKKLGLTIKVYTNGTSEVLAEPEIRDLLALRTDQVRFSIHAIKPHTYRQITRTYGGNATLYDVFRNVKGVMDARPVTGGTKVGIGFIALRENIGELTEAVRFWQVLGVDFFDLRFDSTGRGGRSPEVLRSVEQFEKELGFGSFEPLKISISSYAYGKPRFASRCYAPFEKITVDPYGVVWCCCLLGQPGYRPSWAKVGDLESQSLLEIVEHVKKKFPHKHCRYCTPWEAEYNLQQEKDEKSYVNVATVRVVTADRSVLQKTRAK